MRVFLIDSQIEGPGLQELCDLPAVSLGLQGRQSALRD